MIVTWQSHCLVLSGYSWQDPQCRKVARPQPQGWCDVSSWWRLLSALLAATCSCDKSHGSQLDVPLSLPATGVMYTSWHQYIYHKKSFCISWSLYNPQVWWGLLALIHLIIPCDTTGYSYTVKPPLQVSLIREVYWNTNLKKILTVERLFILDEWNVKILKHEIWKTGCQPHTILEDSQPSQSSHRMHLNSQVIMGKLHPSFLGDKLWTNSHLLFK
jgi:hypothetical protein